MASASAASSGSIFLVIFIIRMTISMTCFFVALPYPAICCLTCSGVTGMIGTFGEAIPYQGGAYGVGILSKTKPLRSYHLPLPGKEEPRTLLVCEFDTCVFFCTHLSLTAESRQASAEIINQEQAKFNKPVLLAGDFNAKPETTEMLVFEKFWTRISPLQPTFPADKPDRIIDYIFVSKNTTVEVPESCVVNEPMASDHRPIFAHVIFK